jgi:mevalonate kinase
MLDRITARAPAKLILSGEHSALYGQPALAMAVDRLTETTLVWQPEQYSIAFYLLNLNYTAQLTLQKLRDLKQRVQNKYNKFLDGECNIREVLSRSFELLQYAFIHIIDRLNITLPKGVIVETRSNIPISCGMGSSAATIMSVVYAITSFFELNTELDSYLQFARDAENLQHGHSSGLDLQISMYGGCARFENDKITPRTIPELPMYIINTGKPFTTTGQCVMNAKQHFAQSKSLALDFAAVTNALDKALQENNLALVQECIRANHCLLTKIGVVPEKVQRFISELEHFGAAGKICGAGATKGQNAGIVLAVTGTDITAIVKKYGYEMFPVKGNVHGIQVI